MSLPETVDWEIEEERFSARAYATGDPTGWLDQLYAAGLAVSVTMPWSRHAVIVGCGLGADAEQVAALGYRTVAVQALPEALHPAAIVDFSLRGARRDIGW